MDHEIATYTPASLTHPQWARIAGFVRDVVSDFKTRNPYTYSSRHVMSAVTSHTHWVTAIACLPLDRSVIFHRDVIADYIAHGTPALKPNSRATRRTMLLRVAETALPTPERVTRLAAVHKDIVARPYTPAEQLALRSWAEGQITAKRRIECRAILALGLGAGLNNREILSLRAHDIAIDDHGVLVSVSGDAVTTRQVPVLAEWEQGLVDIVEHRDPVDWLIAPGRHGHSKNTLNATIEKSAPEGSLRPAPARMRNTWLVTHLTSSTPLPLIAHAAGLMTFRTIERLLPYLPEPSADSVREQLRSPRQGY